MALSFKNSAQVTVLSNKKKNVKKKSASCADISSGVNVKLKQIKICENRPSDLEKFVQGGHVTQR